MWLGRNIIIMVSYVAFTIIVIVSPHHATRKPLHQASARQPPAKTHILLLDPTRLHEVGAPARSAHFHPPSPMIKIMS